ncbi:MAG: translation initiation factor [Planctomycetota bacterium]|jgi:translation initiation factor 1
MTRPRIVWDSELGRIDPKQPPRSQRKAPEGDGVVRIRRETGGRGGKTVTTILGLQGSEADLKKLCGDLKKLCGVGGAVKDFVLEIQGDHRDKIEAFLVGKGLTVKRAGG